MKSVLNPHFIQARDLPDLWFQAVYNVIEHGRRYVVTKGSYAGQTRLAYDFFTGHVTHPGAEPLLPEIPPGIDIPAPVDPAFVFGGEGYDRSYIEYLMTGAKAKNEAYTYGERLTAAPLTPPHQNRWIYSGGGNPDVDEVVHSPTHKDQGFSLRGGQGVINQIEWIIRTYRDHGHGNNQMVLQVAAPDDHILKDPPCLRHIDTKIVDGKLHFYVYFRSWDLWGGLPANLAGIQILKKYMADTIGVEDGEMIVQSKCLHLYGYAEDLAKMRCLKLEN